MRLLALASTLLVLTACGGESIFNFGGEDPGWADDNDGGIEDGVPDAQSADDFVGSNARAVSVDAACDPDGDPDNPALFAEATLEGVAVTHEGYEELQCASFEVWLTGAEDSNVIEVDYENVGAVDCDDACPWTLVYTIADVPPGTWVVATETMTAEVTVE